MLCMLDATWTPLDGEIVVLDSVAKAPTPEGSLQVGSTTIQ